MTKQATESTESTEPTVDKWRQMALEQAAHDVVERMDAARGTICNTGYRQLLDDWDELCQEPEFESLLKRYDRNRNGGQRCYPEAGDVMAMLRQIHELSLACPRSNQDYISHSTDPF